MSKFNFKKLLKQCIAEVITEQDPYDPESDTFAPAPRDRMESTGWSAVRVHSPYGIESWAIHKDNSALYMNPNGKWDRAMGAKVFSSRESAIDFANAHLNLQEANIKRPERIDNSERNKISKAFAKVGLDGNGRFEKKEHGLRAVSDVLADFGFQLDMVSADTIMGDKGSRNLIFRRVNDPGQDPFTEKPEIVNSRISFNWERLDGSTFQYPDTPSKFEILAYAS